MRQIVVSRLGRGPELLQFLSDRLEPIDVAWCGGGEGRIGVCPLAKTHGADIDDFQARHRRQ
jgi:hypothetical protein